MKGKRDTTNANVETIEGKMKLVIEQVKRLQTYLIGLQTEETCKSIDVNKALVVQGEKDKRDE